MALLSDYTAGTVSVAANGTAVTGGGTAWKTAGFKEGDWFIANGWVNVVASVDSETALTLAQPWRGGALTDAAYRLRRLAANVRISEQARQIVDMLGGSGSLEALAAVTGLPGTIPYFTGPGSMGLLTRQDLMQGVRYDVQVDTLADRDLYNGEAEGFAVLVSNTGDGRAAIYTREGVVGNWSSPAYITGPSITLNVTEVDEVPYGSPPDVNLTPKAGGYDLAFEIPRGMVIEPGTTTTLPPGQPAAVAFVPITGGYRLDIALPKGDTGDIEGVTPFWVDILSTTTGAGSVQDILGIYSKDEIDESRVRFDAGQTLSSAQQLQARANIGAADQSVIAFFAHRSGNDFNYAPDTATKVNWATTEFNIGGAFSASTGRFTPPAGQYFLEAAAYFSTGLVAGATFQILIYKNGLQYLNTIDRAVTGSGQSRSVCGVVDANGTDYFEVYVSAGGSGAKSIHGDARLTHFSGGRIK